MFWSENYWKYFKFKTYVEKDRWSVCDEHEDHDDRDDGD